MMGRRNDWEGEWHHRAPDYKLVYCGPKESSQEEEIVHYQKKRRAKIYVETDKDITLAKKMKRSKQLIKH